MVRAFTFYLLFHIHTLGAQPAHTQKASGNYIYYFEKGEQLFDNRDYTGALSHYNECLNLNSQFAEAYYARAVTKEKLNEPQGALVDYTIFLEFQPAHFDARFNKAVLLFEQKKWQMAKLEFTQLLTLPVGSTASVYYRQDRHTNNTNHILTNQGKEKSHLYNYLGLIELELGAHQTASNYFDSAIYINPNEADYLVNSGICNEAMGKVQDAISAYQKVLQRHPGHAMAMHNLSVLNRKLGASEKASAILDEVITKNPDLPYPYAERAFEEMERGQYHAALNDFNKAIRLAPTEADYWLGRGMVKTKLMDYKGAYNDMSQAILLDDLLIKAWINRGNLLFQKAKYMEAIEDYTVAIYLDNQYAIAYYNRALAFQKTGNHKRTCEDLKKANALGQTVNSKLFAQVCAMQQ